MANWHYTLDIKDEYREARAETLTPHEMAQRIAVKLEALLPSTEWKAHDIIAAFKAIGEGATFDDTDDVMEMLYDWGDEWYIGTFKKCWVATF